MLQAAVQQWVIRTSDGDMHGHCWKGLVTEAGRRRVRNAVAVYCAELREGGQQDLIVHAQDLLSLHRDLGTARVQAHDRSERIAHHLWGMRKMHETCWVYRGDADVA